MSTIWKFTLPTTDKFVIRMPMNAEILFVAVQHNSPCMWARVHSDNPIENRLFITRGTGHPVPSSVKHVGSYMLHDDNLVFHVFEE